MLRVKLVYGRDLDELARQINECLELYASLHYLIGHITYNTSRSDISPSAFIEYDDLEKPAEIYGEE